MIAHSRSSRSCRPVIELSLMEGLNHGLSLRGTPIMGSRPSRQLATLTSLLPRSQRRLSISPLTSLFS